MDCDRVPARRFGKKVDFKGMDLMGLVHLKRKTIQYPFDVFYVVHVMVHIDIAVTNRVGLFHLRMSRGRNLLRFLGWQMIFEEMLNMFEDRPNSLRLAVFQIEDQPGALCGSNDFAF